MRGLLALIGTIRPARLIHSLAVCSALTALVAPTAGATTEAKAEAWADYLSWWPGAYDNTAQVMEQRAGPEPDKVNTHQRLFIRRVNLPAFGDHVFYAEWQDYDDPSKVMRQRFYAMELEGGVQRLNLHIFPNDPDFVARTVGAHKDPRKLEGVTPADMVPLKGCDVFFEWTGSDFTGAMKKRDCAFPAPDGTPIYSWSQMKLDSSAFSYLDGWFHEDDSVYMRLAHHWYVFDKKSDDAD